MGDVTGKTNGSTVKNKAGKETENGQPNMEVIFGEMLWVKLDQGSWWPAQVVDDNSISLAYKPSSKGSKSDVLVRLYGSYTYNYVDIHGSRAEFKDILMKKNFNYESIFKETLEQDLPSLKSSRSKKRQSNSKGSQKDISDKSQVSSKKFKSAESEPQTPDTKANGVYNEPSSANNESSARRLKVMQILGLVAPSGSPFPRRIVN
uniref:uncharacterized protein LOC122589607 isoform X2 n=1 Tax=Erigeron canadensis TaxID=72917 RepID=UPI001CB8FD12|nr:uncharacterized protein LOC122589607 isoform X2 [Erigeron canadensis]